MVALVGHLVDTQALVLDAPAYTPFSRPVSSRGKERLVFMGFGFCFLKARSTMRCWAGGDAAKERDNAVRETPAWAVGRLLQVGAVSKNYHLFCWMKKPH